MIAFVCCSSVQIMRAVHMKMRYDMCTDDADMYLSHKLPGYRKFADSIAHTGIFKHVYPIDTGSLGNHTFLKLMLGHNDISKLIKKESYDKLITFNIEDELAQALYCINYKNPNFEYHCVEDGPNIYRLYEPKKYKWYHPYKLIGWDKQAFHIKKWWTSCPEFIDIPKSFHTSKEKLQYIDCSDEEYIKTINFVFNFKPSKKLENADILIMEESHYTDGLMIDNADYKLFDEIRQRYSNLNVLIKLHPRSKNNRFADDFSVMDASEIPWELYALNRQRIQKKNLIQISIVCGTMVSDRFMFGIEGKKIILAPLFYDKVRIPDNGVPRVSQIETEKYEKLKGQYIQQENFVIAYSKNDIYKAIDSMLL